MDKLKENAYWISLGAIAVVLCLLVWFLVVARIFGGSGDTVATLGSKLEKSLSSIKAYNSRGYVPTEKYQQHLEKALDSVRRDHNNGAREYNDAQTKFNQFFDGTNVAPDAGLFASTYTEKIEDLVEAYRAKFGIEAPKEEDDDGPRRKGDEESKEVPDISRLDVAEIFDETVVRIAMKEYWIAEAIFDAANRLELGGLQKIGFPNRLGAKDEEGESEHYSLIDVEVTLEMPFSKIEDFMTRIFENDRVLFVFDGFEITKTVDHLKPYMQLKTAVDFANADEAARARYADIVAEPVVTVAITLKVLDWKGLAEIQKSDLEGEEEFEDEEEFEEDV